MKIQLTVYVNAEKQTFIVRFNDRLYGELEVAPDANVDFYLDACELVLSGAYDHCSVDFSSEYLAGFATAHVFKFKVNLCASR